MSDLIDRQALLKQIDIDSDGEPGYYGDTWKFIDTIQSMPPAQLSTNLAEVGTDCISRQQAKDALNAEIMKRILADDINDGMLDEFDTESIIRQLPTIQPKRGRWIEYEQEFMLEEPFKTVQKTVRECSVCTAKIAGMIGIMNYCPNCGAKMEVDDE